ncbi:Brp/Blh family beta-carotene 15,15'-dioxygenase [Aquimarina sp. D1M17]|uniref:Brp/Blh family beta-carotene 15,15'-dioxygenase n=1 Tax=Aquimarina acroporae TaxID=2937283 RepID=UPI0020C0B5F7|nr:Brp/Blh family beta-carotene 15,15'-dioxygenase [Aquimarina acroporae]MCK8524092.1 Brp/Blh family beta-carotene 15,15'-dioxygenase [Aquimarina acroporae]
MKNRQSIITNLTNTMLIATFFSLWLSVYFENQIENYLAYFCILSLGILHGANDIKIAQKSKALKNNYNFLSFLLSYLVIMIFVTISFYVFPSIILITFIVFSAYHFAEQHWIHKIQESDILTKLFLLTYGLFVLSILFYTNAVEVSQIVETITTIMVGDEVYKVMLIILSPLLLMLGVKLYLNKKISVSFVQELFYLLVFFIVFHTASLLWAFAIYFIFWHSIPSLVDQVFFLYGATKKEDFYKYLKSSFLYWLVSIIGILIIYVIFYNQAKLFTAIFFASLATITFPHVWVMTKLKK